MPWLQAPPPPTSSSKVNLRRSWIAWRRWPRSSVSASRVTSRMLSPFLLDPMRLGSMAKCCEPTAESSERIFTSRHWEILARVAAYEAGPYAGYGDKIQEAFGRIVPDDADASGVARAIVDVVNAPFGKRPFRVHYDPTKDGAEVAFAVIDRVRDEMLHRVGMGDLLRPRGRTS